MLTSHTQTLPGCRRVLPAARVLAACAALGLCGGGPLSVAGEIRVGRGSYNTTRPKGLRAPSAGGRAPARPSLTANVRGAVPTNDWWTSLVWKRRADNPYSENLYAHPLALRAKRDGLGVGYPTRAAIDPKGRSYHYHYAEDLTVGVEGLAAPEALVDGFGDWTVSAAWSDGSRRLRATFGHGLPYVYCEVAGGGAAVTFKGKADVWHRGAGAVGVTINGHPYGLFAPGGAAWDGSGALHSGLGGKGFFSVALLPDASKPALELFRTHAFAFVTDSRVRWQYDAPAARLTTRCELTTRPMAGTERRPLIALYRHQWLHTSAELTPHAYLSPRGEMKLLVGPGFSTEMTFHGVLPGLPLTAATDLQRLRGFVRAAAEADKPLGTRDTYWTGKALGRLAALVHAADQAGLPDARDRFLARIKGELEDWLHAPDGKQAKCFHYDQTWRTLIGCPASYGSDDQLNDHNFHYGYYIQAAAAVARFDPQWAARENWGGMVELLIRDADNWDRSDGRFCFLRCFDPYAGHSWASGHAAFAAGNNQESSSESLNFATGLILWGAATGNQTLRDLGVFLYANETRAVQQYWFDVDQAVFPKGFGQSCLGILWGNGGAYATWWTANPEEIHGINFLPITGGSLYLGRRADYVRRNYQNLIANNGGPEREWRDIIWSFQALADADAAASKLEEHAGDRATSGGSQANTYLWISALKALGRVDTTVTADAPTCAVFRKDGARSHVAWNPGREPVTVRFSDGASLRVSPGGLDSTPSRRR
jgi:endoglucanase Acf2